VGRGEVSAGSALSDLFVRELALALALVTDVGVCRNADTSKRQARRACFVPDLLVVTVAFGYNEDALEQFYRAIGATRTTGLRADSCTPVNETPRKAA